MGFTLKAKEGFKIMIQGTDFEIETIYVRTRFMRSLDGKQLEVQANIYASEDKFRQDERLVLSATVIKEDDDSITPLMPIGNYGFNNVPENYDNNDLDFSHQVVIGKLSEILEEI